MIWREIHSAVGFVVTPERHPQSAPVAQNHKTIEQPERYRRQHEEIDCRNTFGMIVQKGAPALGRRAAIHVPRDRRLSEREAELEQFAMNVWRTPEVICTAHLANELAQFGCDSRPANTIA